MKATAQNASWILAGKGLSIVAQALYLIVMARLLGSHGYGVYVAVVAMVAVVNQYGSLGSGYVFLRHVSRDTQQAQKFFGNVIVSTCLFGPILIACLTLAGPWILPGDTWLLVLIIGVSDCLFAALVLASSQVFQALERMYYTALMNAVTDVLRLAAVVLLLVLVRSVTVLQAALVTLSVSAIAVVFSLVLVLRNIGKPTFRLATFREHGFEGLSFALSSSTTVIGNDIDKVMLGHYNMNVANGIYSLAYRGVSACSMPLAAVFAALVPRFFREGANGVSATYELSKRMFWKTLPLALLMVVLMVLAAPLLPILAGANFRESVIAMRWLCLIPLFRSLQWCAGDAVTGSGYHGIRLGSQGIAAGFNFLVNLYMIPHYSWRGAAWTSIATDGLLSLGLWVALWVLNRRTPAPIALAGV